MLFVHFVSNPNKSFQYIYGLRLCKLAYKHNRKQSRFLSILNKDIQIICLVFSNSLDWSQWITFTWNCCLQEIFVQSPYILAANIVRLRHSRGERKTISNEICTTLSNKSGASKMWVLFSHKPRNQCCSQRLLHVLCNIAQQEAIQFRKANQKTGASLWKNYCIFTNVRLIQPPKAMLLTDVWVRDKQTNLKITLMEQI